jgi:hypothetical protein
MGNSDIVEKETIGTYLRLRYMAFPTEIQRKYQLGDLFRPWSDAGKKSTGCILFGPRPAHSVLCFRTLMFPDITSGHPTKNR